MSTTAHLFSGKPIHLADFGSVGIYAEGRGIAPPRVRPFLFSDPDRHTDLCGRAVGHVLHQLDWRGTSGIYCVTAVDGDRVVGTAWAQPIQRKNDGVDGCNLSYALASTHEGRGIATVLTALACAVCLDNHPAIAFVNVQTRDTNADAQAIAKRLALARAPDFDRTADAPYDDCRYITYRAPASAVAARCAQIIMEQCAPAELEEHGEQDEALETRSF